MKSVYLIRNRVSEVSPSNKVLLKQYNKNRSEGGLLSGESVRIFTHKIIDILSVVEFLRKILSKFKCYMRATRNYLSNTAILSRK